MTDKPDGDRAIKSSSHPDITFENCQELDQIDPLANFRSKFRLPDDVIYLDGNSLGPLPKATPARIAEVVEQEWGSDLISSWNKHRWFTLASRVGPKIANIIGAAPHEVIVADSTSVNLFKVVSAALQLRADRRIILSEKANFPTDLYMLEGIIRQLGSRHELVLAENDSDICDICARITADVAVVVLTHVSYRTGRMLDMARYTQTAHTAGALVVWDLAHSAGAVPVNLAAVGADFAVGCGYKYLNGGPGAPAFLFVAEALQEACKQPLSGWFGHARPFAFEHTYAAAGGIQRFQCGTPPILSLAALESEIVLNVLIVWEAAGAHSKGSFPTNLPTPMWRVGVDITLDAPQEDLRRKSVCLCETFITLVQQMCGRWGFKLVSPEDAAQRGSQICLSHPEGYAIVQALIAQGVIGDFRAPDILRFGFAPMYNSFVDVYRAAHKLRAVMKNRLWDEAEYKQRAAVT